MIPRPEFQYIALNASVCLITTLINDPLSDAEKSMLQRTLLLMLIDTPHAMQDAGASPERGPAIIPKDQHA